METINIEKIKPGDTILAYNAELQKWYECKIIQVEKYLITLEDVEGSLSGIPWYETVDRLKDFDYYRQAG